ncbi:(p)ppGpp synthetase [Pokkaliibacter plantistimulans]|uniref:GTP pyrophosphokinase n=1 Tax=Pokkaliibacter plantistimulans TaxID=1635171 RepID=A0ABX5LSM2_9GAMM|nr:GTP diphosphokinase [Pokkaliibacter plantistimulans]PXF29666.1 (p)ppGpp synthetase [Pokkaliibacter plantistimulans]
MVKVREDHYLLEDGSVDLGNWLAKIGEHVPVTESERLLQACRLVESVAPRPESVEDDEWINSPMNCFHTGLEMALILAELKLDSDSLVAAVLYRSVRQRKLPLERVQSDFGKDVARLIDGVMQMAAITALMRPIKEQVLGQQESQLDNVRKMLVSIIDDVRVALIKLAERTCAIRVVKNANRKKRYLVAREVFDIYAPLAHRLGIGHIKWELEDLSFRYLQPNAYKHIAQLLDEKRLDRQQYIHSVLSLLKERLSDAGIDAELMGRAKHIYSIWRKMQRKNIPFSQVYDIRAVRILVPEVRDCYAALGIVHALWRHVPNEFDDYIAAPKENGYRSLHTAVIGPDGKGLEVQIRTHTMHEEAELGVCAHWRYKGTDVHNKSNSYEDKISWLRQVLEWQEEMGDATGLVEQFRNSITQDRIYVFTPEGHVVDLPSGSTPLDFAYRVHTEIGHSCRGAKISGRIVPLTYKLKTGDQVEILRQKGGTPSRDWLNPNFGYLQTSRGRAKVQAWFKLQAKEENADEGRHIVERELKRLALDSHLDYQPIALQLSYKTAEDMFAALGAGDLRLSQIIHEVQRTLEPERNQAPDQLVVRERKHKHQSDDSGVYILGVGNLLTNMASCCTPLPGDPIIGFITLNRGVSIHRQDCQNILSLQDKEPQRIVQVSWGEEPEQTYPVDIVVEAFDRSGLLRDLTTILSNEKVNILAFHTQTDKVYCTARIAMTLEIARLEHLGRLMDKINQLPNVIDVHRQRGVMQTAKK